MSTKLRTANHRSTGFTLIEMLIIAPMVILLVAATIAAITSLTGQSMVLKTRNSMNYDLQNALNDIENDAVRGAAFLPTSGTLSSPQGSDNNFNGTAAFSGSSSLIIGTIGTNRNPLDPARGIIYYANQPNACNASNIQANRLFVTKVIYYVKGGSLWRRSIVPINNQYTGSSINDYTTCDVPWQRNSCSPGVSASLCKTEDVEEFQGVNSFDIKYYTAPDSTTSLSASDARQARTVIVTINGSRTIAGQTITVTGSSRVTRLNDIDADLTAPANSPVVNYSLNATQAVNFSWNPIPNATSYQISYTKNGVAQPGSTIPGTSFTVLTQRLDTIVFTVTARNYQGSSTPTVTTVNIPSAASCSLQNNWVNYGSNYGGAQFTKTSANIVVLSGLIRYGVGASQEVICNLPDGYRPDGRLTFSVATSGGKRGRIDVMPNGNVVYMWGNPAWISMSGISFVASGTYTWTSLTPSGAWAALGGDYPMPKVTKDPSGRAFIEGVAKNSTNPANGTVAYTLPAGYPPEANAYTFYPSAAPENVSGTFQLGNNGIVYRYNSNSHWSLQGIFYPSGSTAWTTATLANGWVAYGNPWSTAKFTKNNDGIVTIRGLIKNGTITTGTVLFTLPEGYRPGAIIACGQSSGSGDLYARIDIQADGKVLAREGTTAGYLGLSGCDFVAEN